MIPMEELANGTSRRADEGSSSRSDSDAPSGTIAHGKLEVAIDVGSGSMTKPRMEKVPQIMRRDKKTRQYYFDPRVVSVGPYHHGKEELQMAEKIKPIIAQSFISTSGRDMVEFHQEILNVVDDVRSCYVEGSTDGYSDEKFVKMMLVDGLFVSAFIEYTTLSYWGPQMNLLKKHFGEYALFFIAGDIFYLLENQIPFQVLELLMSMKSDGNKSIMEMVDNILESTKYHKELSLLDKILNAMRSTWSRMVAEKLNGMDKPSESTFRPIHCLELIMWKENYDLRRSDDTRRLSAKSSYLDMFHSFRSISQLKAKGIYARPSRSFRTRVFSFKSFFFFAVLEIPPLILNSNFIVSSSNQIAYECTPNNLNNHHTMAFISFMKSLIDSTEDVKELRSKNILFSTCNTDEEVVKMFSNIPIVGEGRYIHIYGDVKEKIQKHYDSKAKTWIAELIHNYFNSPWTSIAFLAATAVVILSFIQTYFTIYPS